MPGCVSCHFNFVLYMMSHGKDCSETPIVGISVNPVIMIIKSLR